MNRFITQSKYFSIVALMLFFLAGCTCCVSPKSAHQNPEAVRDAEIARLSHQLEKSGVRVIQTGETMRMIISSDWLFNPGSANLASAAPNVLNTLAQLMKLLETTSVQVSGYTDVARTPLKNKALATAQAEAVADYLWSTGVDARLLYAVGYSVVPTELAVGHLGNSANRRVEVQFQYLPLLSSLVN